MHTWMPKQPEIKAASVHLLTALGAVCALFAVRAAIDQTYEQAFVWLGVAFVIDGIDGYFARRYDVKTVMPHVSGETLDLCVDYVTYVFVPALMLQLGGHLPGAWGTLLAALICVSSLYHFSDTCAKSEDYCFVGFPAIWNIVAFYIFALAPSLQVTSVLVGACAALTFVRWKWVHPMRVVAYRGLTLGLTALWAATAIGIVWSGFPATALSAIVLVAVGIYGVGLSLFISRTSV